VPELIETTVVRTPIAGAAMLSARDVSVAFPAARGGWIEVVRSATFDLHPGEILGLVGESGSGKTVTSLALMGMFRAGSRLTGGSIAFDGRDVTALDEKGWRELRGNRIAMVMQQPARALNPAFTVGRQIAEVAGRHLGLGRKQAWEHAVATLDRVHIPDARQRAKEFPHQFSGGMAQRVLVAMALACEPSVIIADEPTTALDVTVQAHILQLLRELVDDTGVSILYITHDLAVVAQLCERAAVMYAGEVVEVSDVVDLFERPRHPYTQGLLDSIPVGVEKGGRLRGVPGQIPSPGSMPAGCRFHPRCAHVLDGPCTTTPLELVTHDRGADRCVRSADLTLTGVSRGTA